MCGILSFIWQIWELLFLFVGCLIEFPIYVGIKGVIILNGLKKYWKAKYRNCRNEESNFYIGGQYGKGSWRKMWVIN